VAVASGALALTAAAIPAAQASGNTSSEQVQKLAQQFRAAQHPAAATAQNFSADGTTAAAAVPYPLAVTFSNVKVNSGKPAIYVGTTGYVHVPYSFTLTGTDVDVTASDFVPALDLYYGTAQDAENWLEDGTEPTCKVASTTSTSGSVVTVENCTGTIDVDAEYGLETYQAGSSWHTEVYAVAFNGQDPNTGDVSKIGYAEQTGLAAPAVQRLSRLSVNAAPEPVKKNATLTITGALTRADWNSGKYSGYVNVPVKLQFRKSGSSTYTTVKTINTDSKGNLKTTAKATASGFWRYSFAGTATTPAVNAAVDGVTVK
jgi:hypothetical protein